MTFLISFAGRWGVLLALTFILGLARGAKIHVGWLLTAFFFSLLSTLTQYWGAHLIPFEWNWVGKALDVCLSLVLATVLWFTVRKPPSAAGLTFAQKPGSILPAIVATFVILAFTIGAELWAYDGVDLGAERLAFQATMPGLDEEMFWRGVFLLAMNEAVRGGRVSLFNADITWAGLLITVLFGLSHGMRWTEGTFAFSWDAIVITGAIGFGLYWLRERTGSVIIPIIVHNLSNVLGSFF